MGYESFVLGGTGAAHIDDALDEIYQAARAEGLDEALEAITDGYATAHERALLSSFYRLQPEAVAVGYSSLGRWLKGKECSLEEASLVLGMWAGCGLDEDSEPQL